MQCGALHVYDTYLGECCVDRVYVTNFMLMRGYGRVEMNPLNLKLNILWYKREGKNLQMTNIYSSKHTLLYTMK